MKIEIDAIDNAMFAEARRLSHEAQQLIYRSRRSCGDSPLLDAKAAKLVAKAEGIEWARHLIYAARVKQAKSVV
jgi:hypothetical protein